MNLASVELPEDLDEFWAETAQTAREAPLWFKRKTTTVGSATGHKIDEIQIRGVNGEELYGWFAFPAGGRRCPAFLVIPPYGKSSVLPSEFNVLPQMASLGFNFHGLPYDHEERYTPSRGYFAEGIDAPETWVFRTMFQNAYLAARVLQAQIEVDEDHLGVSGMSQGGGMSIWLGAFCPIIRAVAADMPFLSGMKDVIARDFFRYPMKELMDYANSVPLGHQRIAHTLGYFDTSHLATRCQVPTQVSLGEADPSARPANVELAYEALPGVKRLIRYDIGHDWHDEMPANNSEWFAQHLV